MAVLGVALDASTDRHKNWLAVGGFISSAGDWADFDVKWRARLAEDGLTYFHMVDFAHSVEEFDGWKGDERRRRRLLDDLLGIIESHVYCKVGFMVEAKGYGDDLQAAKEFFGSTAFAAAGFLAISGAFHWCAAHFKKSTAHVFFEEGDNESGSLNSVLQRHGIPRPTYLPKKDDQRTGRKAFTPLHAADILAYEMTKATTTKVGPGMEVHFRHPFQRFNRMPGDARFLDAENLPSLDEIAKGIQFFESDDKRSLDDC